MKLTKFIISIILLFIFNLNSYSQERIYVNKKEFKVTEEGFKTAWDNISKGNFQFFQHRAGSYLKAVKFYEEAYKYNSENAELNLLLGISYLRSYPKTKSLKFIQKAIELKFNVHPKSSFLLARALHLNSEFNKAIIEYSSYKDALTKSQEKKFNPIIDKYISECENGLKIEKNITRALVDDIDEELNSVYDDYNAVLSTDGDYMIFTSRRGEEKDRVNPIDDKFYEDIYVSKKDGKKWESATNIGEPINTKWNDAAVELSEDGEKLIIYRGREDGGDLYSATQNDGRWKNIHEISQKVNSNKSNESSICFTADGKKMYFVSNIDKNNLGGRDIYVTELPENSNKWSKPKNIGATINTEYDEASVYITSDEKFMYFSSKGHNTIGGYDIFKSEMIDGEWNEPENMGIPINSPDDDLFFNIQKNNRDAYYSSSREDGIGQLDIYHVVLLGPEKPLLTNDDIDLIASLVNPVYDGFYEEPLKITYTEMTIVKGTVTGFNTGKPLESDIEIVDNANGKLLKKVKSNINTGAYTVNLPTGKNYGMSVNADGYMFHSEYFIVPAASGFNEIYKNIALQPMTPGSKIILYNTFFDSGKSTLRSESFSELNRLAKMFEKYPNLVLEISGHTDNRGSKAVNTRLSLARAKSVVNYLKGQGVKDANLKAVGLYFKFPVATNKTEAGRQENRRVEAKILSN
ncbi:MAG: OmpA family protein [Bacteroidales bacterium]|nr:OmpA family protein [Bacteroidales bacterium]